MGRINFMGNILTNVIIIILYVFFTYYYLPKQLSKSKDKKILSISAEWIKLLKIKYTNIWKTIVLPVLLIFLLWIITFCYLGLSDIHSESLLEILSKVIFTPIGEEIIFRGFLVGFSLIAITYYFKSKYVKIASMTLVIIITSILFSIIHSGRIDYRFFVGIICGIVLVINKNITASITAHTTSNILAVFLEHC